MAESVTIHEAKTQFSKLVRRAEAGEEIVVRRGRDPVARIAPLKRKGGVTGFGSMKGEIWIDPSDPDLKKADREIERLFDKSEIFPGKNARRDKG